MVSNMLLQRLTVMVVAPFIILILSAYTHASNWAPSAEFKVKTLSYQWFDRARDRYVPVKIYYPENFTNKAPLIIFSHGLGGSREGYSYLGNYWAQCGYISAHIQHIGSDSNILIKSTNIMQSMRQALKEPSNFINRPLDVSFAIDVLIKLNDTKGELFGRIDTNKIGVAGHSFGAWTSLALIGYRQSLLLNTRPDSRIKAAIIMSPPSVPPSAVLSIKNIKTPVFYMTGTLDSSLVVDTKPEERRAAFDIGSSSDQYLLTLNGADHLTFADGILRGIRIGTRGVGFGKGKIFRELICISSVAFWDAYLKGDERAFKWLTEAGFQKRLEKNGVFEKKLIGKQ